ncbi:hypothetical protein A2154_02605 [Candidatus Gottesmanbacteria bacterium RBG_16_43_7]|uniref:Uncharacterized protein n=1 Tax=Candidatus Gottesmanbacteria bacterium RBG_16_43_7 TaxID=1798373 RepID=A0A1F5ZCU4_9BACT|nr:MAG: hypothetical protein A2154_02605 [Candidatus Gottesmanbacteria bacterium RBG_16_43_7]
MQILLEREVSKFHDKSLRWQHPGSPGINHHEIYDIISQIPDGSWKLPDIPFAQYNILRMIDFLTRAWEGYGIAHLAARGIKIGELRTLEAYTYFHKVMTYNGTFEEQEAIIISALNGMKALVDAKKQPVTEEDVVNARAFLTSYVSLEKDST